MMYYAILSNLGTFYRDTYYVGYTKDPSVVRWFAQNLENITIIEYDHENDMWEDLREQGLADDINPLFRSEYQSEYDCNKQFGYPPLSVEDDCIGDIALDDFAQSMENIIVSKSFLIHSYMIESDMKDAIKDVIVSLSYLDDAIEHHRLGDESTMNIDLQMIVARWILQDGYFSYYLGEY